MMYKIHNSPIMINHEKHQAVKGRHTSQYSYLIPKHITSFQGLSEKTEGKTIIALSPYLT